MALNSQNVGPTQKTDYIFGIYVMLFHGFSSNHTDMFWQMINQFTACVDWNGLSMIQGPIQGLLDSTFPQMMNGHVSNFMDQYDKNVYFSIFIIKKSTAGKTTSAHIPPTFSEQKQILCWLWLIEKVQASQLSLYRTGCYYHVYSNISSLCTLNDFIFFWTKSSNFKQGTCTTHAIVSECHLSKLKLMLHWSVLNWSIKLISLND